MPTQFASGAQYMSSENSFAQLCIYYDFFVLDDLTLDQYRYFSGIHRVVILRKIDGDVSARY